MGWLNSLDPLRTLFFVQFAVQAVLLGVVIFLIFIDRKKTVSTSALDELKTVIGQTAALTEGFRDQIQEKVDVVARAMAELDHRVREARAAAEGLEKALAAAKETRAYTQTDVIRLHKGGFDPVDISQITGIPVGEVQLMVKVSPEGSA